MKHMILIATILLSAPLSFAQTERSPNSPVSCRYGSIVGHGKTIHEARSQASLKCFDRELDLYEKARGSVPDGEAADFIMDSCVNLTCQ